MDTLHKACELYRFFFFFFQSMNKLFEEGFHLRRDDKDVSILPDVSLSSQRLQSLSCVTKTQTLKSLHHDFVLLRK